MRLWGAQAISQTANNMVNFALLLRVGRSSSTTTSARPTPSRASRSWPFSLPVGDLRARLPASWPTGIDRRTLMAATNVLRAVAMVLFLVIQPTWQVEAILISTYVVTFLFGIAGQFFAPAQGATIPDLVPAVAADERQRAVQPDEHGRPARRASRCSGRSSSSSSGWTRSSGCRSCCS
jgi:hypothetical protein